MCSASIPGDLVAGMLRGILKQGLRFFINGNLLRELFGFTLYYSFNENFGRMNYGQVKKKRVLLPGCAACRISGYAEEGL